MQPEKTPEKGFQWDEASKSYGIPSQVLRGEVPVQPNAQPFQPYQQNVQPAQQMMGNGMMGNGMMAPMAETKATTAFVLSLVALIGFFIFPLTVLIAPISLIMANNALKITNLNPSYHPDHGKARAAQIISAIITVILGIFLAFLALLILGLMIGGF
ncbi:MAG: hypothetical protein L7S46_07025 [Candidatus Poseidoniaceae archaeon]|nr:hypothetical protein [Candidatus Poseidoniaceae archaeon]